MLHVCPYRYFAEIAVRHMFCSLWMQNRVFTGYLRVLKPRGKASSTVSIGLEHSEVNMELGMRKTAWHSIAYMCTGLCTCSAQMCNLASWLLPVCWRSNALLPRTMRTDASLFYCMGIWMSFRVLLSKHQSVCINIENLEWPSWLSRLLNFIEFIKFNVILVCF